MSKRKNKSLRKQKTKPAIQNGNSQIAPGPWGKKLPRPIRHIFSSWKGLWAILSGIATIIGIASVISFIPRVTVDAGETLNPKNQFETRFVLQNQSLLPIYNIEYSSSWFDGTQIANADIWFSSVDMSGGHPKLEPSEKFSMRMDYSSSPILNIANNKNGILQIEISYRPAFWKKSKNQYFQFFTKKDSEGNFHWFPATTGQRWTSTNYPPLNP